MKTYPRKPLVEISDEAKTIYRMLCEEMDNSGFIDLEGAMEVNIKAIKMIGKGRKAAEYMTELQSASMVFAMVEKSGWMIRFPIVRF